MDEQCELRPRSCEQCDCGQWEWDGRSAMHRYDPPEACMCGHLTMRHRFLPSDNAESGPQPEG